MSESSPLRILLVDDTPEAESYIARSLQPDLPLADVLRVPGEAELSEALADDRFDVVITESQLAWTDGLGILRAVKERQPEHPVVMLTSHGDEELAAEAIQAGFDAYLRKAPDHSSRLAAAVNAALETARERAARQRAEAALVESEARHRAILEAAPDTVLTLDEHGTIESINPVVRRMFGFEPAELLGRHIETLMLPEVAADVVRSIARYLRTGEPHVISTGRTIAGVRKDGSAIPLDLALSEVRLQGRRLFTGILRDISERRRSEEERSRLLERERAATAELRREAIEKTLILENMLDAVVVTDAEGRYTMVNGAAGRLLGMDPSELIGLGPDEQPWSTRDESGDPLASGDRPLLRALRGERTSMVQRIRTVDDREIIARVASAPVRNVGGAIVGAVHVIHDITEDYTRARQVAEGARLRSLGQLAGGVAHDLNQYLGLVVGYGDLGMTALADVPADLSSARDCLTIMIKAAEDGAEGVRRLLLFARPSSDGPSERVDLDEILREVAKLTAPRWRDAAQQEGRPIAVNLVAEGDGAIDGWPSDLREAFTNLVFNAVDALPRGGAIQLRVRTDGDQVVAEVSDNGTGMTPETRERLFEPFFSTKGEGGSGLGMAIVFGIVERHGGTIDVESTVGQGTTFRLAFPAATSAQTGQQRALDADVVRRLHILVVDDEPSLVTMLSRLLMSEGHEVSVATSGEEALAVLAGTRVDVIISDLGMGAGMNGWELAASVQTLPHRPHFVLTTGWGAEIDPEVAAQRGVVAVVSKPYRLPDLRKVLNTL